ncbi:cysteine dioxygenase [Nocardioides phosphati]|uniref:Cysteine dioxygenase n=1 Tax=Nocardioides phosphati TaxID=1867775 RepID=A0ABQ2N8W6_9ACTN|nr:cysteine dioxygenase family protein [Nocardioides phosphati]GGO88109.1 cysteine dioxygenase [Nocardioides phosphati]
MHPTAPSLTLEELAAWTRRVADQVRSGEHEIHADTDHRWHARVHCDDQVDVWLISWTADQGTELHDHGGSAGAFTVVQGRLTETAWSGGIAPADEGARSRRPGQLTDLVREAGETSVFGGHYVHDVRNLAEEVAVSVHAYSPPLSRMHYYDVEAGRLVRRASAWTDDPEAPAPAREAS